MHTGQQHKTVRRVNDPLLGKVAIPGVPVKFSASPDRIEVRAARLGKTMSGSCTSILSMPDEQIRQLYLQGVLVRESNHRSELCRREREKRRDHEKRGKRS